ncbi:histidine kinase, phosphotransfer Hpt, partial [Lactarius psammicola]
IDMEVFGQILDLDDDDDEFSQGMVDDYFSQAEKTFTDMATALKEKDLDKLSSLGHFLKGSSAALGVFRVQTSCEDIQHYGQLREGLKVIEKDDAIAKISTTLARAREEYKVAKSSLEEFYGHPDDQGEEPGEESD